MHTVSESLLDGIGRTDADSAVTAGSISLNRGWVGQPEKYQFMLVVIVLYNVSTDGLERCSGILLSDCADAAEACLTQYDISPCAYTSNEHFRDNYTDSLVYLDDQITRNCAMTEDLYKTANIRIQFNLPPRFQNFIRLLNYIYQSKYCGMRILTDSIMAYRSVPSAEKIESYSLMTRRYEYMPVHLGYIDNIFTAESLDINNYMSVYKMIESFYGAARADYNAVKDYIGTVRQRLRRNNAGINESLLDDIGAQAERADDLLNSQPDGVYWDERPDTHQNMYVVSIFSGTEEMVWTVAGRLMDSLGEMAGMLLDNADVCACCSNDPGSDYYIYDVPEWAVRTRDDDPFYDRLRETPSGMHQAQVRIQFNPPHDFRRMAKFISLLHKNGTNIPHVYTRCTTYATVPGSCAYGMTHTKTEVVNRIFNIISLELVEQDSRIRQYAGYLTDALLPFYHDPATEKTTLDIVKVEQFVMSVFRRSRDRHLRKAQEED